MSRTVFATLIYGFDFDLETDYENIENMRSQLAGKKYSLHDVIYHVSLDNSNEYIFGKELAQVSDGGYEVLSINLNEEQKQKLSKQIFAQAKKLGINTEGKECQIIMNLINI